MDTWLFFQAIGALCIVVGLVFLVFAFIRFCESKGIANMFLKKMNVSSRLSVIESKRLDAKNTLILAQCDDEEYLILSGTTQNIVLQTKKRKQ